MEEKEEAWICLFVPWGSGQPSCKKSNQLEITEPIQPRGGVTDEPVPQLIQPRAYTHPPVMGLGHGGNASSTRIKPSQLTSEEPEMSRSQQALPELPRHQQINGAFSHEVGGVLCCSSRTLTQQSSPLMGLGEISVMKLLHALTYESLREVSA